MKKFLLLIILFISVLYSSAQEEKPYNIPNFDYKLLHFGFTIGLNVMDFGFERNAEATNLYADVTNIQPGFQVSAVSDLRLGDHFNLRFLPGISFGAREIIFYDYDSGLETSRPGGNSRAKVGPAFLDFPLHLKYRSRRDNNYRPYLIGGVNFRYDMAAKKDFDGDSNEPIRLNSADLYVEIGFGVDTYLKYFKFAPEIKFAVGFNNMHSGDPGPNPDFANSITRLTSYIVMLNFHFE